MFEAIIRSGDNLTVHNTLPPVGAVMWLSGNTIPDGCLPANGAAVSRTGYAELFAAVGTTWGNGDGSTTFNVPDARGRFPEGAQTAGGYKAAGLPNITGVLGHIRTQKLNEAVSFNNNSALNWQSYHSDRIANASGNAGCMDGLNFNASRSSAIYGASSTVQPPSVKLLPVIVYRSKHTVSAGGGEG